MIPPQAEEFMPKRMGATVRTVASSHASLVSHRKGLTQVDLLGFSLGLAEPIA